MVKILKIDGEQIKVISYNSYNDRKGVCLKVMNDATGNYLGCIERFDEYNSNDSQIISRVEPLIKQLKKDDMFI